jgi:hypothetical protein
MISRAVMVLSNGVVKQRMREVVEPPTARADWRISPWFGSPPTAGRMPQPWQFFKPHCHQIQNGELLRDPLPASYFAHPKEAHRSNGEHILGLR